MKKEILQQMSIEDLRTLAERMGFTIAKNMSKRILIAKIEKGQSPIISGRVSSETLPSQEEKAKTMQIEYTGRGTINLGNIKLTHGAITKVPYEDGKDLCGRFKNIKEKPGNFS
jgi:hypothetical protein